MAKKELVILSHWYHLVEGLQESSQEFYKSVEAAVKTRSVPDARISRIDYHEGGILSAKREYLRVRRKELIFDICAAPFETGFFTSWWLGEKPGGPLALILLIRHSRMTIIHGKPLEGFSWVTGQRGIFHIRTVFSNSSTLFFFSPFGSPSPCSHFLSVPKST